MQSPTYSETISVGDLLQKVSSNASKKLIAVLEAMPAQTPELRYEKIKSCITKLKMQLLQLLAILMWLKEDNAQKYLQSMRLMEMDIRKREMQLDGIQDAFYYLHQSIYSRRRQPLDVAFATDIMARGTYAHLPTSIFTFKSATENTSIVIDPTGLNVFIGCKLCLSDSILNKIEKIEICNGNLVLINYKCFKVTLTLSSASEIAYWIVTDVVFTVEHRHSEGFIDSYGHKELEIATKSSLNKLLKHKSTEESVNIAADKSVLSTVCVICQHVTMSIILKLLYLQALYDSRNLSDGFTSVNYFETSEKFVFEYSFWANTKNAR